MADYLKLFHDRRLSASEPHHLTYIKSRLAAMKIEDPNSYEAYSKFYGIDLDVKEKKEEPKVEKVAEAPQIEEKKRGRKAKISSPV